jgi:hypothetical protein
LMVRLRHALDAAECDYFVRPARPQSSRARRRRVAARCGSARECTAYWRSSTATPRPADWPEVAAENVTGLRLVAGRHPKDPQLADLVGELSIKSPEFRTRVENSRSIQRGRTPKRMWI